MRATLKMLTSPNSLKTGGTFLKADTEAAHAGKKLDNADILYIFHFRATSFCAILDYDSYSIA
jgi:hypothetical protein